ncbi:biotin--[acetyl-CoA-carboxylase] ligase [Mycobacterium sp.]|uniref:biotin--[acetyl-CoA-carboxylase] ligase n=1 Tax=Mycobacterium sp. TaxID=1785 RepID=UPI002DADCAA9|nr:biotin--[acetyl-CoA-carboxylase] ligase [Mycobacterium sp.]
MTAEELRGRLDAAALRDAVLGSSPVWRRVDVVPETGSTNADLIARAAAGEDIDGTVLIAEHQTAARGRQGRQWSDVAGAQIAMSVGVDAGTVPTDRWGWLPLATGVAIVDAVAAVTGVEAGLKWPNDVLAGSGKLAGILAEVAAPQRVIVVGLGLNVTLRSGEIPAPEATSLLELGVDAPNRARLIEALLHELGERIVAWRNAGGADDRLVTDYRTRCLTLGASVRAVLPDNREITGIAQAVDEQGRLSIESNGQTTLVSAGDVTHLRPI